MTMCQRSLLFLATFLTIACGPADPSATLSPAYPDLLRQARVEGIYRFSVRLDSTGTPDVTRFRTLASPNPAFDVAVRRAVGVWRPHVQRGTDSLVHTVVFVILPIGADSSRDCPRVRSYTLVCTLEPRVTTLYSNASR
jgi:hypothetical protein